MALVLFNPYQVLPHGARVDVGAMAMKGCTVFPKPPALLGPHQTFVSYPGHSLVGGVLPLCREAVGVFYSPSRLGKRVDIQFDWLSKTNQPSNQLL